MKSLVIGGVVLFIAVIGIVFAVASGQDGVELFGDDMVNTLSAIAAIAILGLSIGISLKYLNQMKYDKAEGELADGNWDGIGEFKNELPVGWALSFLALIVWAVYYFLVGWPLNSYSQIGEYNDEVAAYNQKFESKYQNASADELERMGETIFIAECKVCHGAEGTGLNGKAANLTEWGNEAGIINSIVHGAKGLNYPLGEMPAGLLDAESAKAVAAYIMQDISKVGKTKYPELVETGKALFGACAACHGEDGNGMGAMAPSLVDYGTAKFVVDVLERGKKGHIGMMPAFKVEELRITKVQQKAVGAYLSTLSQQ